MKKFLKYFSLLIVSSLIFSGCETNLFKPKPKTYNFFSGINSGLSTGSEYKKQLAMNFNSHSDSFGVKYDFCNSEIMNMKAKSLSAGNEVLPQNPYNLSIDQSTKSELIGSWQFLDYVLKHGGASQKKLANLHFYYECWIHQIKDKENGFFSTVCKNQFIRLMNQIISGCKTNFLVEFSPSALEGSGLSGLALDSSAQAVIYSFLKHKNDTFANNKFLIVGEKEHAIKVANFMNVQAGIEKSRLKIIISDKMDEGVVGLFVDSFETRYCFTNSHKKSFDTTATMPRTHNYSGHNEIREEESNNLMDSTHKELLNNEINFNEEKMNNNSLSEIKKPKIEEKKPVQNIVKKNDRVVERIK